MAALRAGISTVVIPADNESDLDEIDQSVRKALKFVTADHLDAILDVVLDRSIGTETDAPVMNEPAVLPPKGKQNGVRIGQ